MCPAEHGPCEDPQTAFNHQLQLATHRLIGVVRSSVSELLWYTWTLESWLECAETLTGLSSRGSVPARVYPLIAYWYYLLRRAERVTRREIILCLSDAPQPLPGFDSSPHAGAGCARPARGSAHTERPVHGGHARAGRGRCGAEAGARRAVPDRTRASYGQGVRRRCARSAVGPGWCEYRFFSSYLNTVEAYVVKSVRARSPRARPRRRRPATGTAAGRPAETPKHGDPSAGRYSVLRFIAVRAHLTLGVKRTSPESSHTLLDPRPKI